jgi:hypothetical protein
MIDMTETERAALAAFAGKYGHQWKAYLKAAWLSYRHNGLNMGGQDSGTLREIRNTRGMRWLEKVRTADLQMVRTKDNTSLDAWWQAAIVAFAARGLSEPLWGETRDAYQVGESPETWADYVLNAGPDFERERRHPVAIVNGLVGMPTPRLQRMLELLTEQPNGDPGCVTLAQRIRVELAARLVRDAESSLGTLSAGQRRDLVADRTSWDRVTIDAAVAALPD